MSQCAAPLGNVFWAGFRNPARTVAESLRPRGDSPSIQEKSQRVFGRMKTDAEGRLGSLETTSDLWKEAIWRPFAFRHGGRFDPVGAMTASRE